MDPMPVPHGGVAVNPRTVFLDRDGTIIEDRHYLADPDGVALLSGAASGLRRLQAAGITLEGAADHGVSEALYLHDPDGNGLELYRDRPESEWPRDAGGVLRMVTDPLDLNALLSESA